MTSPYASGGAHPEDSLQHAFARLARDVELLAGGVLAALPLSERPAVERRGLEGRPRDVTAMAGVFLADPAFVRAYGEGTRPPLE